MKRLTSRANKLGALREYDKPEAGQKKSVLLTYATNLIRSSEYLSPERSKGEWHDERLSDIWALGVTFFEIATGRTPFEHEDEQVRARRDLDVLFCI